jgi:hypothetical protein
MLRSDQHVALEGCDYWTNIFCPPRTSAEPVHALLRDASSGVTAPPAWTGPRRSAQYFPELRKGVNASDLGPEYSYAAQWQTGGLLR